MWAAGTDEEEEDEAGLTRKDEDEDEVWSDDRGDALPDERMDEDDDEFSSRLRIRMGEAMILPPALPSASPACDDDD